MPTALITGAGGGIGSAIAAALAPTHTLLLAGRPSARLDTLAERLGAPTWPLDLADRDSIEASSEVLAELDVLVHNAGVLYPGRVAESSAEQWRASFEINVTGAVALTIALLPALRAVRGHVVFINSGAGLTVSPGMASYSASKFALRAFADSLRADEPSLRVTSIFPGRTDSDMQRNLVAYEERDYRPDHFLRPETVAGLVVTALTTPPDGHVHEIVVRPG
ncbi:SDR family oxidoreductase [Mycobacterium sp. 141]|uniref:SDR family oxidoreductase n=1 Tax=Mycobacterium sp. 141 TaxID=1120797 RepID=UPI00036C204A|nr:SDR family oxidoreductase [Mycobacterium sp. 141]